MSETTTNSMRALRSLIPAEFSREQKVTFAAIVLIFASLGLRTWGALGGWFYVDDFKFLSQSADPLTLHYLLTPHDNKLMPGGLLITWLVGQTGDFPWLVAASTLVVMQAIASVLCWIMLRTMFGARKRSLVPLAFYLFTPMTLTSFMWWGSAINLIPVQIAFFGAVTAHYCYLDSGKRRYIALTALSLAFGFFFYQKTLLILPILPLMAVGYFSSGPIIGRIWGSLKTWRLGWISYAVLTIAYLTYHVIHVPSPVSADESVDYVNIVATLFAKTFATTAMGGPWQWSTVVTPAAQVDPPIALVGFTFIAIAAVIAYGYLRRRRTMLGWFILGGYFLADALLLASGRGSTAGTLAAVEPRYVSDAAPAVCLVIALTFCNLRSPRAVGSTAPRTEPLLAVSLKPKGLIGIAVILGAGCLYSNVAYIGYWHEDFAARKFVNEVKRTTRNTGNLHILDLEVPQAVLLGGLYPYTLPSNFFNRTPAVRTHTSGTNLMVLNDEGFTRIPIIKDGPSSTPPLAGSCGTLYSTRSDEKKLLHPKGITVKMDTPVPGYAPWITIGYLATSDSTVRITTGDVSGVHKLERGPNTLFIRGGVSFSEVGFSDLSPDATVCISRIRAGIVTPSDFS